MSCGSTGGAFLTPGAHGVSWHLISLECSDRFTIKYTFDNLRVNSYQTHTCCFDIPGQALLEHLLKSRHSTTWASLVHCVQDFALPGIPDRLLAYLQGMVHRCDLVQISDLRRISQRSGAVWDPAQSLQFGVECLQWMKSLAAEWPNKHIKFNYNGSTGIVDAVHHLNGSLPGRLQALESSS